MQAINPANGRLIREYPDHTPAQVQQAMQRAKAAFQYWRRSSSSVRSTLMIGTAAALRRRSPELSALVTAEMGKPISAARAEVEKCAACCDYFAANARRFLANEMLESDAASSYVRYDPLGPVLAVMPWNFPFWQVFRFAAPAIMAGNVCLLKHASNVPGCSLAIEDILTQGGAPAGVFQSLLIDSDRAEKLIADPAIAAVTLTGSTRAGMKVAAAAGRSLKKCVLELGGSDPFIVLDDVDVKAVAGVAAAARCINSGQSCIAAKRFIVHAAIAERFEEEFVAAMAGQIVGDPMDEATQVGPMAREDLLDELHDQVMRSLKAGARLATGGMRMPRDGCYYAPTVLTNVTPDMPVFREETFGPVAAVIRARDADDAVRLANLSDFGLGASIWTHDIALAESIAERIEAGCVFINGAVKSDPRLPFGGIKQSGYGRELSAAGIREFVNIKTVWVGK